MQVFTLPFSDATIPFHTGYYGFFRMRCKLNDIVGFTETLFDITDCGFGYPPDYATDQAQIIIGIKLRLQ
jgi:hypothetical protein